MRPILVVACLLLAMAPSMSRAADLTINFNGSFKRGTCAFSVKDVDLGTYQAASFTGSTATPWTQIVVQASSCTSDISTIHMQLSATADSTNPQYFAVRNVSGNVTGVGIQMMDRAGQPVAPNATTTDWSIAGVGLTYNFFARFTQTRPTVTSGAVSTPITIQFTYN
jgi:type 1 fimbria pilin